MAPTCPLQLLAAVASLDPEAGPLNLLADVAALRPKVAVRKTRGAKVPPNTTIPKEIKAVVSPKAPQRVLRSASRRVAAARNSLPGGDGSANDAPKEGDSSLAEKPAPAPASRGAQETTTKENVSPEEEAVAAAPSPAPEMDATGVDENEGALQPQSAEGAQAPEGTAVAAGTKRVRKPSRRVLEAREHQASGGSAKASRKGRKGRK